MYWQPTLESFLPENISWIFGIISCMGYVGIMAGNKGAEILWKHLKLSNKLGKSIKYYWCFRLILPLFITIIGLSKNLGVFVIVFIIIYFVLGAGNLFENTIFHNMVINSNRSSMTSISSLFLRGGGIVTTILGSAILYRLNLSYIWIFLPLVMFSGTVLVFYKSIKFIKGSMS